MRLFHQRGVAAVELTLMLPFLLLVIFATAELGRAMYQYNTLTKSVRDAARFLANIADISDTGILPDPLLDADCSNCIRQTKNLLVYGNTSGSGTPRLVGLSPADITITISPAGSRRLLVSASYAWQPLFGESLSTFGLGDNIDLGFRLNTNYAVTAL